MLTRQQNEINKRGIGVRSLKNILISLWTYRVVRISLGITFVWAGSAKLLDVESFANIIAAYELVPENVLVPVALGLPAVELLAGLCLIFDVRGSLTLTLALLVVFALILWFGILKDLDIDCGCFSAAELAEHDSLRSALYRDLGMIATGLYLFWWRWVTRSSLRRSFFLKTFMKVDSPLKKLRQTAS